MLPTRFRQAAEEARTTLLDEKATEIVIGEPGVADRSASQEAVPLAKTRGTV
jgi:hypothetical protein